MKYNDFVAMMSTCRRGYTMSATSRPVFWPVGYGVRLTDLVGRTVSVREVPGRRGWLHLGAPRRDNRYRLVAGDPDVYNDGVIYCGGGVYAVPCQ